MGKGTPRDAVTEKLDLQEMTERCEATRRIASWCLCPWQFTEHACKRVKAGYREHRDNLDDLMPVWEAVEELCDVGGYAGIALRQGRWSWRWWVAVVLVGLAFRVMGRLKL